MQYSVPLRVAGHVALSGPTPCSVVRPCVRCRGCCCCYHCLSLLPLQLTESAVGPAGIQSFTITSRTAMTILQSPSQLFRSILRAHKRHLPTDLRSLGDTYVKQEFRLHKTAKPEQVQRFMTEWNNYLDQLLVTARAQESMRVGSIDNQVFAFGKDLPPDVELSSEQRQQLEKLREEAAKAR